MAIKNHRLRWIDKEYRYGADLYIDPDDWWIGVYIAGDLAIAVSRTEVKTKKQIYVCLLPTVVLRVWWYKKKSK